MSFYEIIKEYRDFDVDAYCSSVTPDKIRKILTKDRINELDFLALLSDAAVPFLEQMACRARDLTRSHFGNVVFLFTPLYISNVCENVCAYCSFARQHRIKRRHLSAEEVRAEAQRIARMGIRHILVLTGESPKVATLDYLKQSITVLKEYFSSIAVEIYALDSEGYGELVKCGVDGLTIYQETYDESLYMKLHQGGPKEDYLFRLEAPERGGEQGMRAITIGALLGLAEPRREAFLGALHSRFLQSTFPSAEVSLSFPRIRPLAGEFRPAYTISDKLFVQFMTAYRIFMPHSGITVSTRESLDFRNAILPMGPTKVSAGVSTSVGGHSDNPSESQFEIADTRSVEEMKRDLKILGFQPVMHDWNFNLVQG
ncbi:MAG: 2-iminoacetate synthase ThiH [Chitinispirillaceae bacterium]